MQCSCLFNSCRRFDKLKPLGANEMPLNTNDLDMDAVFDSCDTPGIQSPDEIDDGLLTDTVVPQEHWGKPYPPRSNRSKHDESQSFGGPPSLRGVDSKCENPEEKVIDVHNMDIRIIAQRCAQGSHTFRVESLSKASPLCKQEPVYDEENAKCYADRYHDLKAAFGYDTNRLIGHYTEHGKNEGREFNCDVDNDINAKNLGEDLGVKNWGEDCWSQCNQGQGPCDHCGTGLCCRYGWGDTSGGCDGTVGVQGHGHHSCSVAPYKNMHIRWGGAWRFGFLYNDLDYTPPSETNIWVHYAFTFSSEERKRYIYRNGALVQSGSSEPIDHTGASDSWSIGHGFNVEQTNLARSKPASQITTWGAEASRAVDGNTNGFFNADTCTHTNNDGDNDPWWRVDLQETHCISKVVLFNRWDCCSKYSLSFTERNSPFHKFILLYSALSLAK